VGGRCEVKCDTQRLRPKIGNTYDINKISRPFRKIVVKMLILSQNDFPKFEELASTTYRAPYSAAPPQPARYAAEGVRDFSWAT
jgi:hypothetical protein